MKKLFLLALTSLCLFATSCSKDKDTTRTTSEVTERFIAYFYDKNGNIKCNKMETFSADEWAVCSVDGMRPLEVFKDITGMKVSATESYSYKFISSDGQSSISISGNTTPNDNHEYATIKVSIPSCSDIQTIYIGSEQYFTGAVDSDGKAVMYL